MSNAQSPDALKNLVLFMIKLAILGLVLAFAWFYLVDLPLQQAAFYPPLNTGFT
ncbi:MAG: hypothetical protein M0Q92_12955 [Methanoregula sp.]|jgi:hypothetical protein|nr:hypothetical protein [Methanoregula sp.]